MGGAGGEDEKLIIFWHHTVFFVRFDEERSVFLYDTFRHMHKVIYNMENFNPNA
jgi:hypothetical protein